MASFSLRAPIVPADVTETTGGAADMAYRVTQHHPAPERSGDNITTDYRSGIPFGPIRSAIKALEEKTLHLRGDEYIAMVHNRYGNPHHPTEHATAGAMSILAGEDDHVPLAAILPPTYDSQGKMTAAPMHMVSTGVNPASKQTSMVALTVDDLLSQSGLAWTDQGSVETRFLPMATLGRLADESGREVPTVITLSPSYTFDACLLGTNAGLAQNSVETDPGYVNLAPGFDEVRINLYIVNPADGLNFRIPEIESGSVGGFATSVEIPMVLFIDPLTTVDRARKVKVVNEYMESSIIPDPEVLRANLSANHTAAQWFKDLGGTDADPTADYDISTADVVNGTGPYFLEVSASTETRFASTHYAQGASLGRDTRGTVVVNFYYDPLLSANVPEGPGGKVLDRLVTVGDGGASPEGQVGKFGM
uniref:Uncharacterized protein n=1 Tax=viral metagenome TaxID=1070528 RepID=A0A2V0RA13_9ZZZZ